MQKGILLLSSITVPFSLWWVYQWSIRAESVMHRLNGRHPWILHWYHHRPYTVSHLHHRDAFLGIYTERLVADESAYFVTSYTFPFMITHADSRLLCSSTSSRLINRLFVVVRSSSIVISSLLVVFLLMSSSIHVSMLVSLLWLKILKCNSIEIKWWHHWYSDGIEHKDGESPITTDI